MQDFLNVMESLVHRWETEGLELLAPLPRDKVIARLNETGRKFSADVVTLYSLTGGMADCNMDSHCWSLWPLNQVLSEGLTNASRDLAFADFLIYSHLYRFRVESEARSSVWIDYGDHADEEKAAATVAEFFEKLLLNPGSLQMFD